MEPVRKQIVYDENKNPIGVMIPIEDWKRIESQLGMKSPKANGKALMAFFGKIDFQGDPVAIQRKLRSEWPE